MGVIIIDDLFNEYFPDVTTGIIEGVRAHPQIRPVAIIPRFGKHLEGGAKLICGLRGGLAAYEQGLERWLSPLIAIRRDFLDDNPVIFIDQPQAE